MNCIPIAGVQKCGHAGEGLLNLKGQKIILLGLKTVEKFIGLE